MRSSTPSNRWIRKVEAVYVACFGHNGPATWSALRPQLIQLYRSGASYKVAGQVLADHYRLHSSCQGWRELAEFHT